MNRRWIYLGFTLLAAGLVWWASRPETAPPGDVWDRPDRSLPALLEGEGAWPPFADLLLRVEQSPAPAVSLLRGGGCALQGEELRQQAAWTDDGRLQIALGPRRGPGTCPALELLLRPGEPLRLQARGLLPAPERGALRNLRGRAVLAQAAWDGSEPLALELRVQGENRAGVVLTYEAALVLPAPLPRPR